MTAAVATSRFLLADRPASDPTRYADAFAEACAALPVVAERADPTQPGGVFRRVVWPAVAGRDARDTHVLLRETAGVVRVAQTFVPSEVEPAWGQLVGLCTQAERAPAVAELLGPYFDLGLGRGLTGHTTSLAAYERASAALRGALDASAAVPRAAATPRGRPARAVVQDAIVAMVAEATAPNRAGGPTRGPS